MFFVEGVVGEVLEDIMEIRKFVGLTAHSEIVLLVNIEVEWVETRDKHPLSDVKLEPLN